MIYGRKIAHATISTKSTHCTVGYWIKYKNPLTSKSSPPSTCFFSLPSTLIFNAQWSHLISKKSGKVLLEFLFFWKEHHMKWVALLTIYIPTVLSYYPKIKIQNCPLFSVLLPIYRAPVIITVSGLFFKPEENATVASHEAFNGVGSHRYPSCFGKECKASRL